MFTFDEENKVILFNERYMDKITSYESSHYKSFVKFLYNDVERIIREEFIPMLNEIIYPEYPERISTTKSRISIPDVSKYQFDYRKQKNYLEGSSSSIRVGIMFYDNIEETFINHNAHSMISLPIVSKEGIIKNELNLYAFKDSIQPNDGVHIKDSKLLIKEGDNSFSMVDNAKGVQKVTLFNKKINSLYFSSLLYINEYGLLQEGGYDISPSRDDVEYLHNLYLSIGDKYYYNLINSPSKRELRKLDSSISGELIESTLFNDPISVNENGVDFDFTRFMEYGKFSTVHNRKMINKVCSLYNLVGEELGKEVQLYNPYKDETETYKEGTIITEDLVSLCHYNRIDHLYFKSSTLLDKVYLAEVLMLLVLPKGLTVCDALRKAYPLLADKEVVENEIELSRPIFLTVDSYIDNDFCKMIIDYNKFCETHNMTKIEEIKYKYHKGEGIVPIPYTVGCDVFYSNRFFLIKDLRLNPNDYESEYVYIDRKGAEKDVDVLTIHDVISLMCVLSLNVRGVKENIVGDIDNSFDKKILQVRDLYSKYLSMSIEAIKRFKIFKHISRMKEFPCFDTTEKTRNFIYSNMFKLLLESKSLEILDMTNPLSVLSDTTKVNVFINKESVTDTMRAVVPSHYGRICPYEIPQSKSMGIVSNTTCTAIVQDGMIKMKVYPIDKINGYVLFDEPVYISVNEQNCKICDLSSLVIDNNDRIVNIDDEVLAILPDKDGLTFENVKVKMLDYVSASVNSSISHVATTIPFIGCNYSPRITFGLSMAKQCKSLTNPEYPLVGTDGFDNIPNMLPLYLLRAKYDGVVQTVDTNKVIIQYDDIEENEIIYFPNFLFSTYTVNSMHIRVKKNDRVKKGDILVESCFMKEGKLATGINSLIAYVSNGYNYEDGVYISERLASKLESYGSAKQTLKSKRKILRAENVEKIKYIQKGDVICDLLDVDDLNIGMPSKKVAEEGKAKGFYAYEKLLDSGFKSGYQMTYLTIDPLSKSDKICTRHGNKGVSCFITRNSDMPYLSNGEFLDQIYNPCGIISRMIIGQILETHLGLACKVLNVCSSMPAFMSASIKEIAYLLEYAYEAANLSDIKSVNNKFSLIPDTLKKHVEENIDYVRTWKGVFDKNGLADIYDESGYIGKGILGYVYIYKLVQEGEHKLGTRGGYISSNYVSSTERPTKGIDAGGGQGIGRMEVDALLSHGASYLLQELFTFRCDDYVDRNNFTAQALFPNDTSLLSSSDNMRRSVEYFESLLLSLGVKMEIDGKELEPRYYKKVSAFNTASKVELKAVAEAIKRKAKLDNPDEVIESNDVFLSEEDFI